MRSMAPGVGGWGLGVGVWIAMSGGLLLDAGEAADAAAAMRLPASGPALAAAARGWDADALLALFADSDPMRRRGAARLAAALPVPAERLLPALLASQDSEVRRLAAHGLRGLPVPLAELARLPDPETLAGLIAAHPAPAPLQDAALTRLLSGWLEQPATAAVAARLIAARGDTAHWGEALVKALAHNDPAVVAAAHGALQILTRTQRNLDAYAGDRRLLAQDWRDALAARPPEKAPDPELMALVAELPAPEALAALLARGPSALAAIERAQADATRARRRELEPAARLLVHAVPPSLHQALGAAAFADLDHPEAQRRIACLRALAAEIRSRADPAGVGLLLAGLDDADAGVRATALDQLVRLSDEAKRLKREWKLGEGQLFAPERTVHRLRRSLRDGSGDEQIAALLLIGSLEAKSLTDDVMALILAPRADVVDTALETITRLDPGDAQIPPLSRLAADAKTPVARRVTAIKTLGEILKRGRWNSNRGSSVSAAVAPLLTLTRDPDQRLASAAAAAISGGNVSGPVLRGVLEGMFARGMVDAAMALADDRGEPEIITLVADRLAAGGADADMAALSLAEGLGGYDDKRRATTTAACARPEVRARLQDATTAGRCTLAVLLKAIPLADALPRIIADKADRVRAYALLAERAADTDQLVLIADSARAAGLTDQSIAWQLRRRAIALAARSPLRIAEVVANAVDLIGSRNSSSSSENGRMVRTLSLEDGSKLRLEAPKSDDRDGWDSDDLAWTVAGQPPAGGPDEAGLARLATVVADLHTDDDDDREARDLALAWLRGSEPDAALAKRWQHDDDLCRLLAVRWPAFRAAVVDRIIAESKPGDTSLWQLRAWLRTDPVRLLPVAVKVLAADDDPNEYEAKPIVRLLGEQKPDLIAALLPDLLARPKIAASARPLLAKAGPLPLSVALSLAEGAGLGGSTVVPLPTAAGEEIAQRLGRWSAAEVLARAAAVRQLRTGGAAAVDAALATLTARGDAAAAAWLRTGIPAEAGMLDAYRSAESSVVPELALVGSAFALKENRLDMPAFLARVAGWPSPVQIDAAAAAKRYGEGKWPELAAPAAALTAKLGARALPAWIAVLPPAESVVAALAERAADPATADAMGGALANRLAREPQTWQPAARSIAARANGRLDWLAPKTTP